MCRRVLPAVWMALACCIASHARETVPESLLEALVDFERYAERVWHDAPAPAESGYFGDGRSEGNGGIRGTCGIALAYAVLVREYPQGEATDRRLSRVSAAFRYASGTHRAVARASCIDGKQWGHGWQTSLWAGSMGFACAILKDRLSAELTDQCRRVVASEADRLAEIPPPSGNRGDSKAEENAWNSNVLALAAAWGPESRRDHWTKAARKYLVNTYTVPEPGDTPLQEWITTANLLPSFAMENHGFFHPSYQMVSGMSLGDSRLMARTLNPAVAGDLQPFAEYNVLNTWRCLERVLLDSGELAYPSGLDWSLHGYGQISYYAWLATHFQEGEAHWACARLSQLIRQRQQVNGDGRFTGESCPNGFYTEAVKGYNRRGAAEDTLAFKPSPSNTPRYAIILPGADARVTEQVRQSLSFQEAETGVRLDYRTPGGEDVCLKLPSAPPKPPYTRLAVTCRVEVSNHREVFSGGMRHAPLPIQFGEPVEAESVVLTVTASHDPRYPNAPRNLQVAELILLNPR